MRQTGKRIGAILLVLMLLIAAQGTAALAKTHTLGNSLTNQMLGSKTCEYNGRIYYAYDDKVYSIKKDGTNKKTEFAMKDADGCNGFSHLVILDESVYAIFDFYGGSDATDSRLISFSLNAGGSDYKNHGSAVSVHAADGKIYYTKSQITTDEEGFTYSDNKGIYVMNADGSGKKALVKKKGVYLLGVDGTAIYFRCSNSKTYKTELYRCDMAGKNQTKLISGVNVNSFAISGNYLYYSSEDYKQTAKGSELTTTIYRKSMTDNSQRKIYSYKGSITNFYVNDKTIYVSAYNTGLIQVNTQTGKSKVLNKHTGAGICGVHGSVTVFEQFYMDMENGTDIDMILAKTSTGKKIKKIGAYFVS